MRQPHPPAGNLFLLCTKCDRGEWRRIGDGISKLEGRGNPNSELRTPNSELPPCRHCGGITVQRFPLTLALTAADRGLLKAIADWQRIKTDAAAINALHREFRHAATERSRKGKPIPQWAAEWLQKNPEK